MSAKLIRASDMRIAEPLAEALNGWREAQAGQVTDWYVAWLDAKIAQSEAALDKSRKQGWTNYGLERYLDGLYDAREAYVNPPRTDE